MADYIVHKAIEIGNISAKVLAGLEDPGNRWLVTPKYDGCHAVFAYDNGKLAGVYSRTGEAVRSLPHIAQSLLDHYPGLAHGKWAICGEAWTPGLEFNEVSGLFRKHSPSPTLGFVPFDVVPWDYNAESTAGAPILLNPAGGGPSYEDRLFVLTNSFVHAPSLVSRITYSGVITGGLSQVLASQTEWAQHLKQLGTYDGVIVANAHGRYSVGSGKGGEFVKLKPLVSYSVRVVGYEQAAGAKTGKNTVALLFDLDGQRQRVSTGLTQAQVDAICGNFEGWRGLTIEVEAMGKTVNGLLREPRFKGIRTDA